MSEATRDHAIRNRTRWLAAAFALAATPALPVITRQTIERPESVYVWLAPILVLCEMHRRRAETSLPHPVVGAALLLLSSAALVIGVIGSSPTLTWAGLALGCVSLSIHGGWPVLGAVAPLLAWPPIPLALPLVFTPALEAFWAAGIHALLRAADVEVTLVGSEFTSAGGARMEYFAPDNGFVLAHGYTLLGAWHASRTSLQGLAWVGHVARFAATGFVLQGVVLLAAAITLVAFSADAGRTVLRLGPSLLVVAGLVALIAASTARPRTNARD